MSDPRTLQQRIEASFARADLTDSPVENETLAAFGPLDALDVGRAEEKVGASHLYSLWFGGMGLILGAVVLALGARTDILAPVGALSVIAVGAALAWRLQSKVGQVMVDPGLADDKKQVHTVEDWEITESSAFAFAVHDALGDIAVTRGMDRRIIDANLVFRRLLNCSQPEGKSLEEFGLKFRPTARRDRYDVEVSTPRGVRIYSWHDLMVRRPTDGRLVIQCIGRDMTDELLLLKAREEARLAAERDSAEKSRLLATVSHEVRTPLGGILGMVHLLDQTALTAEQRNYIDGIRHSGASLLQLVGDLLDFSSLEAGHFAVKPQVELLRPLVESASEMLAYRAHEKNIEIATFISPDVPEALDIDGPRLRQVLYNLAGNAVKFTHQGGVRINVGLQGTELVIDVIDTGRGLTEEECQKLFNEYQQAGSLSDRQQGTGLGLSISARIIRQLGGKISVNSTPGLGSTFSLCLPINIVSIPRGDNPRRSELSGSAVLFLGPDGPAARAMEDTVLAFGGVFRLARSTREAANLLEQARNGALSITDIVVDHRFGEAYASDLARHEALLSMSARRIFLVNPEERSSIYRSMFDAWLIRPLRQQSLIDVLTGRLRGMERRDAINDNRPVAAKRPLGTPMRDVTILLGEDDPVGAILMRTLLERSGHKVDHHSNFESLLQAVFRQPDSPKVLITDLDMPGSSGLAFLETVRRLEAELGPTRMPILVVTADLREETSRQALKAGADRILAKPADPARLAEEVDALLPRQMNSTVA